MGFLKTRSIGKFIDGISLVPLSTSISTTHVRSTKKYASDLHSTHLSIYPPYPTLPKHILLANLSFLLNGTHTSDVSFSSLGIIYKSVRPRRSGGLKGVCQCAEQCAHKRELVHIKFENRTWRPPSFHPNHGRIICITIIILHILRA